MNASTSSSQVFTDPISSESNHVAATLSMRMEELKLDYIWSNSIQFHNVFHPHKSPKVLIWIFRRVACELVLLHHCNQSWFQLKIVCFNRGLSHSKVFFSDDGPPEFLHCVRPLLSLCFFFFCCCLQSFYLISHTSIFSTSSFSNIFQGSFNFYI